MNGAILSYAHNSQATCDPFIGSSQLASNGEPIVWSIETSLLRMLNHEGPLASRHWLILPPLISVQCVEPAPSAEATRQAKNEAAIRLLREWLADESGYDEQVWPIVKKAIEENRSSYRSRFSE